jgi:hypothetical protein
MVVGVDADHPVLQPTHPGSGQEGVVAGSDFPGPQFAAQELVEKGKEKEAIVGFDQQQGRMVGPRGQGQGGVETPEPTPNDHHGLFRHDLTITSPWLAFAYGA